MRILQLGFGTVGKENIRQLLKHGYEVAAVVGRNPHRIDLSGFDFKGKPPIIGDNLADSIAKSRANLILQATAFDADDMIHVVRQAAAGKCDIISVNPVIDLRDVSPELFNTLDLMAKDAGIRVIGVGVIPGFYSDILPLFMTGTCTEVTSVRFRRRADFSKWGRATTSAFGFGATLDAFERQVREGSLPLFRNLRQSANLIARELGWAIEKVEEIKTPVVSKRERNGLDMKVLPGQVGGVSHRFILHSTGSRSIDLEVGAFIDPAEDETLQMSVEIEGNPQLRIDLYGDILQSSGSIAGTSARVINSIEPLRAAEPGLRTTADLSLVHCTGRR